MSIHTPICTPRILANPIFNSIRYTITIDFNSMSTIFLATYWMLIYSRFIVIKILIYSHCSDNWSIIIYIIFHFRVGLSIHSWWLFTFDRKSWWRWSRSSSRSWSFFSCITWYIWISTFSWQFWWGFLKKHASQSRVASITSIIFCIAIN